ncbi:MAG: HIT family hydrolase [Deltaproteobacteria bacterium RIFOXYA12_FULL_61_11]|nr:MAG: HIT family hydrolase [Deltaproteobacteria bacterium RIFOXYA12_FULL_61_11]
MVERLWAPWRLEYLLAPKPEGCVFCLARDGEPETSKLVLRRYERCFVILNKYPYTNGHLMVVPNAHCDDLVGVDDETLLDMGRVSRRCLSALRACMRPEGFNLGYNLGSAAGAGIDEHLHFHIVPRWNGDTNFMAVLADTRVISEHLTATMQKLSLALEAQA